MFEGTKAEEEGDEVRGELGVKSGRTFWVVAGSFYDYVQ